MAKKTESVLVHKDDGLRYTQMIEVYIDAL